MKKLSFIACATLFAASFSFGADGAKLYKSCIACHGAKAEKSYLNGKVPVLTTLDPVARLEDMKAYKAGTLNGGKGKIGQGGIMKAQMAKFTEDDLVAINDYITSLK